MQKIGIWERAVILSGWPLEKAHLDVCGEMIIGEKKKKQWEQIFVTRYFKIYMCVFYNILF